MTNSQKREFAHDFTGNYELRHFPTDPAHRPVTFSLGIFRWIPKVGGKGLKKSAVMYRVKGYTSNPEPVYRRAEEVCKLFDRRPKWTGKKSETVR